MSTSISLETIIVAGLQTTVYRSTSQEVKNFVALFLLHGRYGSSKDVDHVARDVLSELEVKGQENLIIITFDHRNHGSRLLNNVANHAWNRSGDEHNDNHATDMYGIQTGTARDVSFLIDFLPPYLFPLGDKNIINWGMAGISLGGHSTWITLGQDSRITFGIPIIGCPDYSALIKERAKMSSIPVSPPYFPSSLLALINQYDSPSTKYRSLDNSNPFWGKKILVLSGQLDTLVPWSASQPFVESLQVGSKGLKKVKIFDGVGHLCTKEMVDEMIVFIFEEILSK